MEMYLFMFGLLMAASPGLSQLETQPQQVHIAYGETPDSMTVTWVTFSETSSSVVEYGLNSLNMVAKGNYTLFVDGGPEHRKIYMHRVTLQGLTPGKRYLYHVGFPGAWSVLFAFQAKTAGTNWSPRLAVYGDMGNVNPQSLGRLQEETQKGMYDAILHVGDFAYDLYSDNARVGDSFMRQIEAVAAYVPYMTCVGNHESSYNFSNYKNRFTMPKTGGDGENMFFSFDLGPAHFISFSSEFFYFTQYGTQQIANQNAWLKKDLAKANLPENRAARPWVITMAHRPMYCSNNDKDDCTNFESKVRAEVEDMFYDAGVDLMFWAHEHSYERLWPLYNRTMCNGSDAAPYTNPTGPVHIITGSAGCYSKHDPFKKKPNWSAIQVVDYGYTRLQIINATHLYLEQVSDDKGCSERHDGFGPQPVWSALRTDDYGYTRMNILNETHLYLEQVSDDKAGQIVDRTWLIKDKHGPGLYTCHKKTTPPAKPKVMMPKYKPQENYILRDILDWARKTGDGHKLP